jgi:hypothetical protein
MDHRPDMKYTLFRFRRRQNGKDKETEISMGHSFVWLVALLGMLVGRAAIPSGLWASLKWW